MKKEFLPYYISRALLSAAFGTLVFGFNWKAGIFAVISFGSFFLYLHSGWFQVDTSYPLFPLRRDERSRQVQRKALIVSVLVGTLVYLIQQLVAQWSGLPTFAGSLAFSLGILAYFVTQYILLARA